MKAAGTFNKVIQFNIPAKNSDLTGGQLESYAETISVRGGFKLNKQRENFEEGYDELVNEYDAWCYWRKDIEVNISKDWVVMIEARRFKLKGFALVNETRKYYNLKLVEVR